MRALVFVAVAACSVAPKMTVPPGAPVSDVIRRAAHADQMLAELASGGRGNRMLMGVYMGAQGVLYGGIGVFALAKRDESSDPRGTTVAAAVGMTIGALCAGVAIHAFATPTPEEQIHTRFLARARLDAATALPASERDLAALANKRRGQRGVMRTVGFVGLAAGIGGLAYSASAGSGWALGLGLAGSILGSVFVAASYREMPAEKTYNRWKLEVGATIEPTASGARAPTLGLVSQF